MENQKVTQLNPKLGAPKTIVTIIVALIIGFLIFQSVTIIQAGHRGVVLQLGAVQPQVFDEGLHFRIPFIQTVIPMEVRVQKSETSQTSASRDLQTVATTIAVNHHLDGNNVNRLYQEVGMDYAARIVDPAIAEALKAVTAQYTAEELISKRSEVSAKVKEVLKEKLASYYIVLDEINIREFKFSEEFDRAIEAKQVAEQQALKSKLDLERIKIEKEQEITKAQAQAEALRLQKQEVTPELIQLRQIEAQLEAIRRWDGKLPNVTGGATPFINVDNK
ncbi:MULTISPECIES: prohibitin family protein [Brevibacillus]|jgi:regulator of protease activity HflC (stomatin/prohibitin superfamily)|uniref:prohibitin family protein n=1 Tax=Brevibacillus TaxID=55080 RepID=UPI00046867EF|nr:prohibitin family protein [Brevibacillus borstelensis]KKX53620.1 HflC protein [Brevibacillus borstelensis cifa_chp40]MBE5394459.1 prohibitin family protein [Brevibacillus borstelensis]MED1743994.1 prohibitin family protein [Brevibacillus borstelensis]MED1876253.1 prohibitin family protein [Brevibacillus borstelensis]MED1885100.1 prohibitin family protein [Brevibacillus borstelensis]